MNEEEIKKIINEVKKINKEYHYFSTITEDLALKNVKEWQEKNKQGKLSDYAISVKDCICVKNIESTASSAILKGYKPVFNATVIERVLNEGGNIIGKTVQDEFGFGSFCVNVGKGYEVPLNPFDKERVCGGSSGGAAGITQKASFKHIALAESTGGSIANPACFCGVYGFTPTYGLISRYGLISYANSLDKIGIMAKNIDAIKIMFDIIKGPDNKDDTCVNINLSKKQVKRIGIIKSFVEQCDDKIKKVFEKSIDRIKSSFEVKEIELPLTKKYGIASYYIIALAEASTNLARYCGFKYGVEEDIKKLKLSFDEYFTRIRSNYFGDEAIRRIAIGTFVRMAGYRDAYYIRALKVRTKIIEEYKKVFKEVDLILSPTMPIIAPKIDEVKNLPPLKAYLMDLFTVGPNLAGLPHLNVPIGKVNGLPTGMLIIGNHFSDYDVLEFGKNFEKKF